MCFPSQRACLRQDPAFLYLVTDFFNPTTGSSVPLTCRPDLVALARQHGLPVIEDDPYGLLAYDGEAPSPLRAFDDDWIFYVGSFSKIIAPALRLGWIVLPRGLASKAAMIKEAVDLECSGLLQRGFGEGNFKSLFEAIEREQGARGNL